MRPRTRLMICAVLAVAVAACSGDAAEDELPINGDTPPAAAGACLVDEPDCNDTGALPDDDNPLPPPSDDGATVSGGMVADGGLSVSDALTTDATGVIAVQGFLFDDGSGPVLCDALAESFPPQCPGVSIPVSGHEEVIGVPIMTEQGVSWTDQTVVLFGEIVDGTLVVDPTVTG